MVPIDLPAGPPLSPVPARESAVGCFTSGGLEIEIADGGLQIRREGDHPKFVQRVQQISFSGELARRTTCSMSPSGPSSGLSRRGWS